MTSKAQDLIACPACKGPLAHGDDSLACSRCLLDYPVVDGIPRLYPTSGRLTIDAGQLRLKTRDESIRTLAEMRTLDHGFIAAPRFFYALYLLIALTLIFQLYTVALGAAALLFADWLFFRRRRGRCLARALSRPLRLRSVADHEAVDELYRREGRPQPTMSDWIELAGAHAAGGTAAPEENRDDQRYLDILRVYNRSGSPRDVVVDVGANDGRAFHEFGIGRGGIFIGIDVSHLLLREFIRRAPDQTALRADGVCLPLKSASVDFLFCTETLEHLSDPAQAMHEFGRVLRPGGTLMIQSPNAHRIRNLNPFHIAALALSLISDRVVQKKIVHENTWHNAVTYHWDFSVQDYRRMARSAGLRILELRSSRFFCPRFLVGGRPGAAAGRERLIGTLPLFNMFGDDLVLVATAGEAQNRSGEPV